MESLPPPTNYIPSDEEIKDIQTDIVSRSEELARLDKRIRELSVEHDEIQAYIDSQKALISHPRRLPADIVREIFVACLPTRGNAVMSAQEAPLLLCRICSAWRTIALSTPRLWASLHVPFKFILEKEPRIPAVAQWLQRSAACPISISVVFNVRADPASKPSRDDLTRFLIAVADRWRHADFDRMSLETADELSEIKCPLLESFGFSGCISTLNRFNFFHVPSLRTVTLRSLDAKPMDELTRMPMIWNQLRHLTMDSVTQISTFDLTALVGWCPQLISIHISPFIDSEIDSFLTKSTLPFLDSFVISSQLLPFPLFVTSRSLGHLISHVSMPKLRHFIVLAETCMLEPQHGFFLATLGKKSPLIEELAICLPSLTAQSLPETLLSFPSLTKLLVFDDLAWDNDGIQSCTLPQLLSVLTDTAACPMLQELTVYNWSGLDCKLELDGFIQQRMESAHRLQRLRISKNTRALQPSYLMSETEIQFYLSQGLHVSLYGSSLADIVRGRTWG
ncbi:hypothetical protein B0H12DRAFT_1140238 [Mycena haematopus]|nr:hypothetical protein B0H12DRAFT_1140238 [Mycena haematopus]